MFANLKTAMDLMGHTCIKSAMVYQHPELEVGHDAINARHTVINANYVNY
jgi:hypothetical protein